MLVIILMTLDAGQYRDFVGSFDTVQECEEAKANALRNMMQAFPKDTQMFAACVKPRPLHSTDA